MVTTGHKHIKEPIMKRLNEDYTVIEFYAPEEIEGIINDMNDKNYYPVGVVDSWPNEKGDMVFKQAFKRMGL